MILILALGRFEPPTSPLWEARSNQLSYSAMFFAFGEGGIRTLEAISRLTR